MKTPLRAFFPPSLLECGVQANKLPAEPPEPPEMLGDGGTEDTRAGDVDRISQTLLQFGKGTRHPVPSRPVIYAGVGQWPFVLALPMFKFVRRAEDPHVHALQKEDFDYLFIEGRHWRQDEYPVYVYSEIENIPWQYPRDQIGRVKPQTLATLHEWLEQTPPIRRAGR